MTARDRYVKIPGSQLIVIAEKVFQRDPAGRSLEALIADAQQEWAASTSAWSRTGIWVRAIIDFWRALFGHLGRRLLAPPDGRAVRLMILVVVNSLVPGCLLMFAFRHTDPSYSLTESLTTGLSLLPVVAAFVLNPVNLSRRYPTAPNRGWWPYFQFLALWFPLLAVWHYVTGGAGYRLVMAAGIAFLGFHVARLSDLGENHEARAR